MRLNKEAARVLSEAMTENDKRTANMTPEELEKTQTSATEKMLTHFPDMLTDLGFKLSTMPLVAKILFEKHEELKVDQEGLFRIKFAMENFIKDLKESISEFEDTLKRFPHGKA